MDEQGAPWFVAKEVCVALGLTNTARAIEGLDLDEKATVSIPHSGCDSNDLRKVRIINEPGLYTLILRSRKPEAKAFKRWVTHEVLPTIRKKGAYVAEGISLPQLKELNAALGSAIKRIKIDKPKVEAFHKLMNSRERLTLEGAAKQMGYGTYLSTRSLRKRGIFFILVGLLGYMRKAAKGPHSAYSAVS